MRRHAKAKRESEGRRGFGGDEGETAGEGGNPFERKDMQRKKSGRKVARRK